MIPRASINRLSQLYAEYGLLGVARGLVRFIIFSLADKSIAFRIYNTLRYYFNSFEYDALAKPMKTLWVETDSIRFRDESRVFDCDKGLGYICGGTWDRRRSKIKNYHLLEIYRKRFVENRSWEETGILQFAERRIRENGDYYKYTTVEDVRKKRCEYLDKLCDKIEEEGYQSQETASEYLDEIKHEQYIPLEILITIGRDGKLLFYTGHNRMMLAKLLNVSVIPVMVLSRHESWQRVREEVAASNNPKQEYLDVIEHPDLQDIVN